EYTEGTDQHGETEKRRRTEVVTLWSCSNASLADRLLAPRWARGLFDPPNAQVFDFHELIDPVLRALAAETRFLYAAKWRHLRGEEPGFDADHAGFDPSAHTPHTSDVAAVEVRRETELGVVGERDRLFLRLEAEERRHGPEGLFARDRH